MGIPLLGLFGAVFVACILYALALSWCDVHDKFTAHEYLIDRVIVGELIAMGFPILYYLLLHFLWQSYAEGWHGPWAGAREVVFVFVICQAIGGLVMWVWQRLRHHKFYENYED